MYDLRNLWKQQPVVIAGAVKAVLNVAILLGLLIMDEKTLAGIALALEVILNLFVWNAVTPTSNTERHPDGDAA